MGKVKNGAVKVPTTTIKVERAKRDMTQEDLAIDVGVSRQTIHSIEKGIFNPSVKLAIKIARRFALNVEDLWGAE